MNAQRVHHCILSSEACLALLFSRIISYTAWVSKNVIVHKMYLLIFSKILSKTFLMLRRIQRKIFITVHKSSCEQHAILVIFEWNLNYSDRFSKNTQVPNFMKIHPMWAQLFHANGRTDMKLTVAFRHFTTPENANLTNMQ
jgi:hypothetical protein